MQGYRQQICGDRCAFCRRRAGACSRRLRILTIPPVLRTASFYTREARLDGAPLSRRGGFNYPPETIKMPSPKGEGSFAAAQCIKMPVLRGEPNETVIYIFIFPLFQSPLKGVRGKLSYTKVSPDILFICSYRTFSART